MKYWKIIKFFEELIFPHLCYGCSSPGQVLCEQCLREVKRLRSSERCKYCFRLLQSTEQKCCSQCLPSFSHCARSLFLRNSTIQNIYQQASFEKREAIQFFLKAINKTLLLEEKTPQQIIYEPALKKIALTLTHTQHLVHPPIPLAKWKKTKRSLEETGCVCLLSMYPVKDELRFYMERKIRQPSILISLFLQDQHL